MPKNEFDPEDPMEMVGVGIFTDEDTTDLMTECFIEEFMRLGYDYMQLLTLFRDPFYTGPNMVLQNRGEPYVCQKIAEIFAQWGRKVDIPIDPSIMNRATDKAPPASVNRPTTK